MSNADCSAEHVQGQYTRITEYSYKLHCKNVANCRKIIKHWYKLQITL